MDGDSHYFVFGHPSELEVMEAEAEVRELYNWLETADDETLVMVMKLISFAAGGGEAPKANWLFGYILSLLVVLHGYDPLTARKVEL